LLLKERDWDASTSDRVKLIHRALTWGCRDDLELVLKVFAAWTEARAGGPLITASWAWPGVWSRVRKPLPDEARNGLGAAADDLERRVASATSPEDFDPIAADESARSGPVQNWIAEARAAFGFAASETWAKLWCVNDVLLRELEKGRDDRIELLAVRKKEKERRPINFETLDRLRILLVWARPDLCFVREPDEEEAIDEEEDEDDRDDLRPSYQAGPRYERLSSRIEALRRTRATGGGSTVENDHEESLDEAVGPDVELILGDRTVCSGAEPDALIALGSQVKPGKVHPNSSLRDRVEVSFVVRARRTWFDVVPSMDLMGVSVYLAKVCPPAPAAPPEGRPEGAVRRRLFIDQRYPIFGQYRYRPLRKVGERRWEAELVEPVGFWPESRSIPSPRRDAEEGGDEENVTEPDVAAGPSELRTEILVPILNESGAPILDPVSEPPEDVDDSDEDPDLGEEPRESAEGGPPLPPPPVYSLPSWRPIRTVVELVRDEPPAESIAEVVGYELIRDMEDRAEAEWNQGEGKLGGESAVERDLALVLQTPTPGLCFDLFSRGHAVGDRVALLVEGHQRTGGSYVSLLVRDPDSGYEAQVPPEDLGFLVLPDMAERFPVGSTIEMAVDTIDPARQIVRFSLLPLLEEPNGRILKAHGRVFGAEGTIAELSADRVTFLIDPLTLLPDLPPALRLPLTAEVYWPEHEGKIPLLCERGRSYGLKFEFRERRTQKVPIRPIPAGFDRVLGALRERFGPHINWESESSRLTYRGNLRDDSGNWSMRLFDDRRRREALAVSDHPGFARAVEMIYRRSNALDARPADPDLEHRCPPGMIVRGILVELGVLWTSDSSPGSDGKVILDSRIPASIPRDEFRIGHPYRLGQFAASIGSRLNESLATLRSDRDAIETASAGTTARIDRLDARDGELARQFDDISKVQATLADHIGRLAGHLDDSNLGQRRIKEEVGRLAQTVDSLGRNHKALATTVAAREAVLRSQIEMSDTRIAGLGVIVEALAARVEALELKKVHPVRDWVSSHLPRINSWLSGLRA